MSSRWSTDKVKGFKSASQYLLTGLIKCSKCGFAFQGWSGSADGKKYRRYADGGWNNKGVCDRLTLDKDVMEVFAINAIKETLTDARLLRKVEEQLELLVQCPREEMKQKSEWLRMRLSGNEDKIRHLMQALECGRGLESVVDRLKELESEQGSLREQLHATSATERLYDIKWIASEVKRFVDHFEVNFQKAPMEEKKLLVKKMISEVVVDRETNTVRFYLRRLPAITPLLEEVYKNKTLPTKEIVSSASSGGPNFSELTILLHECEYAI
jgi:hypothetical protein